MNLRIKKPKRKINKEEAFIILLVLIWVRTILVSYAYQTLLRIPLISYFADSIKVVIYIFAVLLSIPFIKKNIKLIDYIFYLLFTSVYFFSMLFNSRTAPYLQEKWVDILLVSVPTFFVGLSFDKKYINILHKWSQICMCFIILYFIVIGYHGEISRGTDQNMGLAYRILMHLILISLFAVREKKVFDIFLCIVGAILLFACGTRGAVFSLVVFYVLYVLLCTKRKKRCLIVIAILLIGCLLVIFWDSVVSSISPVLASLGFSTRVLDKLSTGDMFWSNGRDDIFTFMMELIRRKPWTGYGIAGDRNVAEMFGYKWSIAYSHNLFIELIVSFGCVLGILISIYIIVIITKAFRQGNQEEKEFLLVLIFGGGLFKLMFSSSYLIEFLFFFLIGFSVKILRREKTLLHQVRRAI